LKVSIKKLLYYIINFYYFISGSVCSILVFNVVYNIFNMSPKIFTTFIAILFGIPFIFFYLMAVTFTIFLYPIIQIIIFFINLRKKFILKKHIIIMFFWSIAIAIIYLYLIFIKGFLITV
jgi:hypothetical protein